MKPKQVYLLGALICCLISLSSCNNEENTPLRFYNNVYEVPMGGTRYLGLESGNGDYELRISDQRIASAQSESGWSTPGGSAIYVRGILTGKTNLTVTDKATLESCVIEIKVVDNYQNLRLMRGNTSLSPDGSSTILPGISDVFLINNPARDAYFFKQGVQTAFSSGLELIAKGSYELTQLPDDQQSNDQGDSNTQKAMITLTYANNGSTQSTHHEFIMWANPYVLHRLNKTLSLNWDTTPIGYNRTSVAPPPSYVLEEVTGQGEGNKISFVFSEIEMPAGILPVPVP